jgi:hypothetical protein
MAPPPPPPPAPKSSVLKWILIGCGAVTFLGILACGGCMAVVYFALKKAINEGVAKVRPIVAANETVKKEIGELRNITPRWEMRKETRNGRESLTFTLDVEGDKGKGSVLVHMSEARRRNDEIYITLTFVSADGTKRTPIGTYRLHDDKHGKVEFERVDREPTEEPANPGED